MGKDIDKIFGIELFKDIRNELLEWNYNLVIGEALYSKIERYAHIGLKIYSIDYYTDKIIWNVEETQIPDFYYDEILQVLSFFSNYISAIKGRRESICFEIFDGSFNYDTNRKAFMYATIRAIVNCFDKTFYGISESQKERIEYNQQNSINILKNYAKHFGENEIIESLLDDNLTYKISKTLDFNDFQIVREYLVHNGYEELVEGICEKFLLEKDYFLEKNIITKYGNLTHICYGHFCKILNKKQFLPYIGVYKLEKINKYF